MILYDDGSSDNFTATVKDYVDEGFVTVRRVPRCYRPELHTQSECQFKINSDVNRFALGKYRWTAFFDVDEFFYTPNRSLTVRDVLVERYNRSDVVEVQGAVFGTQGFVRECACASQSDWHYPLVTEMYRYRGHVLGHNPAQGRKSFIRPEMGQGFVHYPEHCNGCAYATIPHLSHIRMNHYQFKSVEHAARKSKENGNAAVAFNPQYDAMLNEVHDESVHVWLPVLKEALWRTSGCGRKGFLCNV
jgi:hypothetical protein